VTRDECERITRERLEVWGLRCAERGDTPLLLVTMGHDQHSGRVGVQTCEGGPDGEEIARILLGVANALSPRALADFVIETLQTIQREDLLPGL